LASGSPALTNVMTVKDTVQAMSAAVKKREHRAPNVALMRCELVKYMKKRFSVRRASSPSLL
jgi:hypothetical protein